MQRVGRRAHSAATRCGARAQARAVRLLSVRAAQHCCYHMLRTKQHGLSSLHFGSVPRRRRSRARRAALPRLLAPSTCCAQPTLYCAQNPMRLDLSPPPMLPGVRAACRRARHDRSPPPRSSTRRAPPLLASLSLSCVQSARSPCGRRVCAAATQVRNCASAAPSGRRGAGIDAALRGALGGKSVLRSAKA